MRGTTRPPSARRRDAGIPQIRERRARRRRACLRCGRVFITTVDRRCCKVCAVANAELAAGALVEATTILVRVQAVDG